MGLGLRQRLLGGDASYQLIGYNNRQDDKMAYNSVDRSGEGEPIPWNRRSLTPTARIRECSLRALRSAKKLAVAAHRHSLFLAACVGVCGDGATTDNHTIGFHIGVESLGHLRKDTYLGIIHFR